MTTDERSLESASLAFPSEAQWRAMIDRSPAAIAITRGPDHVVGYANATFRELVGADGEPVESRRVGELLGLSDDPLDAAYAARVREHWIDYDRSGAAGCPQTLRVNLSRMPEVEGEPAGLLVIAHDITDQTIARRDLATTARKSREVTEQLMLSGVREYDRAESLASEAAQLRALFDGIAEGAVIVDPDGCPLLVNVAARRILRVSEGGLDTADAIRRLDFRQPDGTPLPIDERPLSRVLSGERVADAEILYVDEVGPRRLLVNATRVVDDAGDVALALMIFRDVTEVRQLEESRSEYASLIAHDLRGPLTSIILCAGALKVLSSRKAQPEEAANVDMIARNAARMSSMIDDLLETSRLAAGIVVLRREPTDVAALCRDIVGRLDAHRHGRVSLEAPSVPRLVLGDADHLERALSNLVSNALKYSGPTAPVEVRVSGSETEVLVEVVDHGSGIAPDELPHLFERFFRARSGRAAGGTGLGLYIARLIVEELGGRISAESEPGKGSTFRVALPAWSAPAPPASGANGRVGGSEE